MKDLVEVIVRELVNTQYDIGDVSSVLCYARTLINKQQMIHIVG